MRCARARKGGSGGFKKDYSAPCRVAHVRRFWAWTAGLLALTLVASLATRPTSLGFSLWHYNLSFLAALVAASASWRLLERRRVATLTMAYTGILATGTGAVMLYSKDLAYKEWWTWWHSFTSFLLLLAFLVHWLHNNPRLWDFTRRLFTRERPAGIVATLAWIAIGVAALWTWGDPRARALFRSENYLSLSSWAVLAGVAFTYGIWLAYRIPAMHARLADARHRNRARGLVDTSLFLAHWAALVTGFALLWFATPLRAGDLKYVSKWWHTATSVAFLALVALHLGFNARLLAAHARRVDRELTNP